MNEEKLNPMLGYDKEQAKPKLLNNDAIFLLSFKTISPMPRKLSSHESNLNSDSF